MVELQPSKLVTRVRFPSPAPNEYRGARGTVFFVLNGKIEPTYNLPMAKVLTYLKNHFVSVAMLLLGLLFIALKASDILKWEWWIVLMPIYAFLAYWIILISIGAYLTKKEERENAEK